MEYSRINYVATDSSLISSLFASDLFRSVFLDLGNGGVSPSFCILFNRSSAMTATDSLRCSRRSRVVARSCRLFVPVSSSPALNRSSRLSIIFFSSSAPADPAKQVLLAALLYALTLILSHLLSLVSTPRFCRCALMRSLRSSSI